MKGKKIILTGASSGIGAELCALLARDNTVFAVARRAEKIPQHPNVIAYMADVSDLAAVDLLIETAEKKMKGIDVFIANAGFAYYEFLDKPDVPHMESIFRTNVFSPLHALVTLREKKKDEPFTFAVTASAMSFLAMPGYSLYSGTKFALKGFADSYRYELGKGQNLCLVYPIATLTSFFDAAGSETMPWPRQRADQVAKKIVRGLDRSKKHIFPSRLFALMLFMNRFFPVFRIYAALEYGKTKTSLLKGD